MANRISVVVDAATSAAEKSFKNLRQEVANTDGQFNKLKVGTAGVFDMLKSSGLGAVAALGAVTKGAQASVEAASNLSESMNAVDVTFGDASDSIHELGKESVDSFGLSQRAFNEATVKFSSFAKTITGEGGDVSKTMDDLLTRATDFASVHNLDLNEAMTTFQATLAGETEAFRRYGGDVSAAAVELYALENGLVSSKSEMTEAIKVQARYGLLMEQTADTAGDFENTQDSLANTQRRLGAIVEDLSAELGNELLPAVEDVAGGLMDLLSVARDLKILDAASFLREWVNPLTHIKNVTSAARGETDLLGREFRNATQAAWDYAIAQEKLGESFSDALNEFEARAKAEQESANATRANINLTEQQTEAARDSARAIDDHTASYELVTQSIKDAKNALDDEEAAIHRVADARRKSTNDIYAAKDAEDAWWRQLQDTTAALEDAELGEREKAASTRDLAVATDEVVTAQLTANGVSRDTVVGQEAWLAAMMDVANGLSGPMRDEVLNYIALVSGIPAEQLTNIRPDVDFAALKRVEDELNFTARMRDVRFNPTTGGVPRYAKGTKNHPGGLAMVGEDGPELVELPAGSEVHTASATAGMMGGASPVGAAAGSTTINITGPITVISNDPDDMVRKLREHARRNGPIQGIT